MVHTLMRHAMAWLLLLVLAVGMFSPLAVRAEEAEQPIPGLLLETKYINLILPEEYTEAIVAEIIDMEDGALLPFTVTLNEREALLYALILTEQEIDDPEAMILGYLQDELLGRITIVLQIEEQIPDGWTESEYHFLCAMQETINELIMQIVEDPRYDPGEV